MAEAGEIVEAGLLPRSRLETAEEMTEQPFDTDEGVVMQVSAALEAGRRYAVVFEGGFSADAADERLFVRIRQDGLGGAQIQGCQIIIPNASAAVTPTPLYVEITAGATAAHDFVVTGQVTGAGSGQLASLSTQPAYLYVDYVRG